jgi:hypothetical protein
MAEGRRPVHGVGQRADHVLGYRHQGHLRRVAACAWEAEWLAGRHAGDAGRVRAATTMLAEARSWPDAGAAKTGGARRQRDEIATAAANGDAAPLRQDVKVNCDPSWIRSGGR